MLRVVDYLKERGFPKLETPSHDIFTALDQGCGAVSHIDVLTHSVQLGETIVKALEETASENGTVSKFSAGVIQAYSFLYECHKYMVRVFLEDPDSYSMPIGYLDRNLEKWPEPPVRYTFGQPFFRIKREKLSKYERATLFETESTKEEAFLRQYIEPYRLQDMVKAPEKFSVDIQLADNWQYLCGLVDTVFTEYNRDQPEINYQKEQARKKGLHLVEVLN